MISMLSRCFALSASFRKAPLKEQPNASPDIAEDLLISDPFLLAVREGSSLIGRSKLKLSAALAELWVVPRPGGSDYAHTQARTQSLVCLRS